jgi:hypothetical protein
MTQRWLKHVDDGYIFGWTPDLSKNHKLFEVTEEEAFPEKFVPKKLVTKATTSKKKPLNVSTDDIPAEPQYTSPEIDADASRDLPE